MKKALLCIAIAISFVNGLSAQACTAITYNVDLSASVDTSVIIQSTRNGDCCGGTNCIRFDLIINPACSYVNFTVQNPAPPGNAAYYQVNCGPQTSLGTPICVVGQTQVSITFCKPGNDNPIYTITAAGAFQGSGDITVREGCTGSMSVSGLTPATINWTSIYPGAQGAYDSYLSCSSGCTSTNVTPLQGAPAYIDYKVSGFRLCGPIVNDTIRVYTTPQIAVTVSPNNSTICAGSSTTLTATASGGDTPYNYLWSTGQTGPSITVNAGAVYTVSVTDIHNCLPAVQSGTVIIAPVPNAPSLTSNSPVCEGSALNLFASTVPGATYSWTGPNGFTSSLQNPVINNATVANAGSYTVNVTVGQCTSTSATTSVIVNTIPATPVVSTNSPVCEGTNLNLTASLVPGASYSWTGPNNFTSSNQNPGISNAGSVNAGTYFVTATANGCTSTPASVIASVNMLPPAPIVSTNSPLCSGSSINLMAGSMMGATYMWTGPNGFSSSSQNPTIANANTNASGSYSVTATVNGCTGAAGTALITVNPIPASPSVSSNGSLCAGSTLSLSASGIAGASYLWSGPNGFSSSLQNPVINNVTTASAGSYTVNVTLAQCTSPSAVTSVVINSVPAIPVVSAPPVCQGMNLNLTASLIPGATYSWTGPNGFTSLLQNPTIANAGTINSGTYSVTVTANGCTSISANVTAAVNTVPAAPIVSTNGPVCSGSSLHLTASTLTGASYSWTGPNGFASSLQNPVINNVTVANAGSYSVTVTVGQCTSTSTSTSAVINPIPTTPVVSTSPACQGTDLNITASLVPGVSYSWTGPNGFTSSNQNPTIVNAGAINAGTYSVTVTANGCTSIPASVTAIVNMLPLAPIVSTNSPLCSGSSINLMAGSMTGATYLWSGPNGFTSSLQNPTITSASTSASGSYSVTATVNGCTGATGTASIIVNQIPPSPSVSSNGPLCAGSALNLIASGIAGASYLWSGPNGFSSSLQNPVINNATSMSTGIYNASVTVNGCKSPATSVTIVIDQPTIANAGSDQIVCSSNQFVNLTGNLSGGTNSGLWTGSGSGNFSPSNSILNTSYYPSAADKLAGNVILKLTSTNNGACAASSSSVKITFAAAPSVNAGSDQTVCANNANVFLKGQYNNAAGIIWSSTGDGSFSPSVSSLNATYIPGTRDKSNSGVNLILKTTGNTACSPGADTILVTIKAAPVISSGGVKYVLENNSTILNPVISGSNLKYLWAPGIYLNNDTVSNPVCTPKTDVSYKIISIDDFGCSSSADVFVKVLKQLQIPNVFTPNGDGINEKWEVKNLKDYADCKVEIFNRYGQLVYHSIGYLNEWDGILNGKPLPAATYYYVINLKIAAKPISGFVDIVR
ncbi:MAG TPA: gliding motility-associated C-terminal domain-containing protein [Chitinophagaceae bacterium]|jgi:gliding motility-associated-like protein|nr:gliding motility-associated C-terminal domain-containing protein [Chitinophagaceae bacterium]